MDEKSTVNGMFLKDAVSFDSLSGIIVFLVCWVSVADLSGVERLGYFCCTASSEAFDCLNGNWKVG